MISKEHIKLTECLSLKMLELHMPKVSVIIPIYGVEKYIERCVRSLFRQTLDEVEFIFVDDCTTDKSIEILRRLIEEYSPHIKEYKWIVKIDKMPVNSGLPAARRYGIQMATGDYVLHCDSDDWIEDNMLSLMWEKASAKDLDVVVCDFAYCKSENKDYRCGISTEDVGRFFYDVLYDRFSWAIWNKMYKRSLYQNNELLYPSKGMNMGEDMLVVLQLLYYSRSIGHVAKPLYNYRDNSQSISKQKSVEGGIRNTLQWSSNIRDLEKFLEMNVQTEEAQQGLIRLKYCAKCYLYSWIWHQDGYKLWKRLFPEINKEIWMCSFISMRKKFLYYLILTNVYKMWMKFTRKWNN